MLSCPPTRRRRVQWRQYMLHWSVTTKSTRSGYRCVMCGTGESKSSETASSMSSEWMTSSAGVGTPCMRTGSVGSSGSISEA